MRLTFGYAAPEATDEANHSMNALLARVSAGAGHEIVASPQDAYDAVAQAVHKGELDLAWVSPIPFIALLRNESVIPLASPQRGGTHYHGALVVSADSQIGDLSTLAGKRAAWVDRYSAAGFVVPRIELAKAGIDKKKLGSQKFYGSHNAAMQAVANGEADFGATFVRLAPNGAIVGGPWIGNPEMERRLRIFATFGEIPPDVVVARKDLTLAVRERVRESLLSLTDDARGAEMLNAVFGAEGMFVPNVDRYEPLREEALAAVKEQMLEV
jgi:phosphate/phosphite/phosphonate ABC transporter binding protein